LGIDTVTALQRIANASKSRLGPRTTLTTFEDPQGTREWKGVLTDPEELARDAGVVKGIYSVARCVRSEEGGEEKTEVAHRLAVAEMVRNKAINVGSDVNSLLTTRTVSTYAYTRGHYGQQSGRWAATLRDPKVTDGVCAELALYQQTRLLPTTADKFFDPRVMDNGWQDGRKLTRDAPRVIRDWGSEGYQWIGPVFAGDVEVLDPYGLMCFERVRGKPDLGPALEVVRLGRAKKPTIGVATHPGGGRILPWLVVATLALL